MAFQRRSKGELRGRAGAAGGCLVKLTSEAERSKGEVAIEWIGPCSSRQARDLFKTHPVSNLAQSSTSPHQVSATRNGRSTTTVITLPKSDSKHAPLGFFRAMPNSGTPPTVACFSLA
ncbi:MAG: hypothetical protein ACI8TQ_000848 [Planctomycetota bacterium]